jgi:hypothetical protein
VTSKTDALAIYRDLSAACYILSTDVDKM